MPIIKNSGEIRVCIDARKLNTLIIPDKELPVPVEEVLTKFRNFKYLNSIDLKAGYWQCPLNKKSRDYVSFLCKGRNYRYKVLSFGLITSVAEFQICLDIVLGPEVL